MDKEEIKKIIEEELITLTQEDPEMQRFLLELGCRAILQHAFKTEVQKITEFDEDGDVFGQPGEVELDLITAIWRGFDLLGT